MTALAHWNPFRALEHPEHAFDEFMRDLFNRSERGEALLPPVEVAEAEKEVTVTLAVPGVEKEKLDISVDDHVLTVRGEHRKEKKEEKKNYHRQEIHYGSFARSVRLPAEVDAGKATADLKNGMLTVHLPKSANPKAQPIKVNAA